MRRRILALSCLSIGASEAWVGLGTGGGTGIGNVRNTKSLSETQLCLVPEAVSSLLAGSVAGAVGVGAAFPLDTIKTKQQVKLEEQSSVQSSVQYSVSPSGVVSISRGPADESSNDNLWTTIGEIWDEQGLAGFYGGVRTSMLGQAIIKATAFGINAAVLQADYDLVTAAATAGFVTAFLASPVDRIKVLMQTDKFEGEIDCFRSIVSTEGWKGLLSTGLGPTILREVPAYTLYFYLYGTLMSTASATDAMGALAPAISGALAGAACVVPVHPVDVVKTIVQHSAAQWQDVVSDLYEGQGMGGFWEGLGPRMGRAALNHAVTFAVYDFIVHQMVR